MAAADDDSARDQIAAAALAYRGTDTSGLAGAGIDACAASVQAILRNVFGHDFVGGGGDPAWVPDLRAGLLAGGFRAFDTAAYAMPGDIDIQNGQHDGSATNPYENHVGVVIEDPNQPGTVAVISNSSSARSFTYIDGLDFPNIGYGGAKVGPSRFYRYKP